MNNLKKYRLEKKLTQKKLAELVGITRGYLGTVERGNMTPSFETAEKIAKILEVDTKNIFDVNRKVK
ncbi:helix-turn-helix transcriptional regulator [Jeotgalibaca porci]|uniref:helix-turn-helix transcriptional regulator n=1 Tax=Jeotgalibaca porci TaxID=1868793 RepID=UPI003F8F7025